MTSLTDYAAVTRSAETAFATTLDNWKKSVSSFSDQFQGFSVPTEFPSFDAAQAVEAQFAFVKQVVDLNHEYARTLAEVANTLNGVTRQQFESVSNAVRNQAQGVYDVAQSNADTLEKTVRGQADQAERAEREAREAAEESARQEAREAAKAERQQRKEAHDKARARYENLTKAELSEEAAKRDLPKTGTVDELVERLVANDTK